MPLQIVRNDITKMDVDAIVNAANESLLGGGGVDGAIHRAAGPELLKECRTLGGCETGDAKITKGYRLPAKYVIHTVGPVWQGGGRGEHALLVSCYRRSLELAAEYGCETVAFPLISAGAYGYPKAQAMQTAVDAVSRFLTDHEMTVYIVVFTRDDFAVGGRLFQDIEAYIDDVYVAEHFDEARELRLSRGQHSPRSEPLAGAAPNFEEEEKACYAAPVSRAAAPDGGLDDLLDQVDESFSEMLLRLIDERRMTDAECYKRANVDRRLFNKIKNNPGYRPGKQTVLAFAVALRLTLMETQDMLMKAGFALSHSSKADIVVEYCIKTGLYDINAINEELFARDLPLLGY